MIEPETIEERTYYSEPDFEKAISGGQSAGVVLGKNIKGYMRFVEYQDFDMTVEAATIGADPIIVSQTIKHRIEGIPIVFIAVETNGFYDILPKFDPTFGDYPTTVSNATDMTRWEFKVNISNSYPEKKTFKLRAYIYEIII